MGRIPKSDWEWFGNVGHFICGRWCRFHLATRVGDWFVSTVGEYVHPRHSQGSEQAEAAWLETNYPGEDIGYQRKYETMVFRAGEQPCSCGCGMPTGNFTEVECRGYNDAKAANNGHLELCERFADEVTTAHGQQRSSE